jgi:hypothetical protein
MHLGKYGPFADIVALASALVATFSGMLFKMLGRLSRWTWLTSGAPTFLVSAAARMLAVALMAATYVLIDGTNYLWFAAAAILSGILGFSLIVNFDKLRKIHIAAIPQVGPDGKALKDKSGREITVNAVIGTETDLRPEAKDAFNAARKRAGGLSLRQFMAGYGAQRVNDPEALWDSTLLAEISNKLTTRLMLITLSAVMTLFWAAFTIQASGVTGTTH